MFSKSDTLKTVYKNAKKQAKESPLTVASLGIMSLSAANNLYNTETSRRARKSAIEGFDYVGNTVKGGRRKK